MGSNLRLGCTCSWVISPSCSQLTTSWSHRRFILSATGQSEPFSHSRRLCLNATLSATTPLVSEVIWNLASRFRSTLLYGERGGYDMLPVKSSKHFVSGAVVGAKSKCITFGAMKGLINDESVSWMNNCLSAYSSSVWCQYDSCTEPPLSRIVKLIFTIPRWAASRNIRRESADREAPETGCCVLLQSQTRRAETNKIEKDSLVQLSQQHKPQNNLSWQTYHNRNDRTDKEKV